MNKSHKIYMMKKASMIIDYSTLFAWEKELDLDNDNRVYQYSDESVRWKDVIEGTVLVIDFNSQATQETFKSLIEKKLNGNYDKMIMSKVLVLDKQTVYKNIIILYDAGQEITKLNKELINHIKSRLAANGNLYLIVPVQNHLHQFARLLYEYGVVIEGLKERVDIKRQLHYYFQEVRCQHVEWQQHYIHTEAVIQEMIEIYSSVLSYPSFDLDDFKLYIEMSLQKSGPLIVDRHYKVFNCIHR